MKLKPGVKVGGISPEIMVALMVAHDACVNEGVELVITSVTDGVHGEHSLHYHGKAIDLRTRDIAPPVRGKLRATIADNLGAEFDVVLETDHLHIEFDPPR